MHTGGRLPHRDALGDALASQRLRGLTWNVVPHTHAHTRHECVTGLACDE